MKRRNVALAATTLTLATIFFTGGFIGIGAEPAADADATRARREVRMLDDLYKNAIVLITKHYVNDDNDLAAGEAFKALFASMKEKGWHEVRLVDASGEPIEPGNSPKDDFEKEAIRRMLASEPYYDQVVSEEGKRYLRAATPIPVVMDKCIMCHENYRGKKIIGSLAYRLPLQ